MPRALSWNVVVVVIVEAMIAFVVLVIAYQAGVISINL